MILKGSPKGNSRGLGLKNKEERIPFFKSTQSAMVSVEGYYSWKEQVSANVEN